MQSNSSKAFSLIELLLVMCVMGVIFASILNVYKKQQLDRDISLIQANAEQLGQALNLYYFKHCPKKVPGYYQAVTIEQLKAEGLLDPNKLAAIPWVSYKMSIAIENVFIKDFHLWVAAKINQPQSVVDYIKGRANAVDVNWEDPDPKTIRWLRLPSQKPPTMGTDNWILDAGRAQFFDMYSAHSKSDISGCQN